MSIKIIGLGGFCEVGRSAVLIDTGTEQLLFDYGIDVQTSESPYEPLDQKWAQNVSSVFLSHAHLDHSGHIPFLYRRGYTKHVHATETTHNLCSLLLRDSLKVQELKGERPHYTTEDIIHMERHRKNIRYGQTIAIGSAHIAVHDAGHTPGSALFVLEAQKKRFLYTGDINFIDTVLMRGARSDFKDIDVVICEATYAFQEHPNREDLAQRLKERVRDIYSAGGVVILPCFAVGRTQEILLLMKELDIPIYLDGMGITASKIILSNPASVRNARALKEAFGKAKKIANKRQRFSAVKKAGVIITTSGMLNGGPVNFYIKKMHKREDCALFLTGFQVPGTVGHTLLTTGRYVNEGMDVKPKFTTEYFDFSSHTDRTHLLTFIKKTNPEKIVLVHGDRNPDFAGDLTRMGFNASAPKNYVITEV
jgi:putative mRNA 3-end processing factor